MQNTADTKTIHRREAVRILGTRVAGAVSVVAGVGIAGSACTTDRPSPASPKTSDTPEPGHVKAEAHPPKPTEADVPKAADATSHGVTAQKTDAAKPADATSHGVTAQKTDAAKPADVTNHGSTPKADTSKKSASTGSIDCSTEGKIDKGSQQMRTALQYVDTTKKKGQECEGCLQWVPAAKGKTCGGCRLFTGPVSPKGYCLSFVPSRS